MKTKKVQKNFSAKTKKALSMRNHVGSNRAVLHGAANAATVADRKAIKRRQRPVSGLACRKAGLPEPSRVKPGSKAFKALQRKWDAKLAQAGFEDIECSTETGERFDNYLRGSAARGRTWSPERAQFYRLLQNYLTHHQFRNMQDRFVLHKINDGWTYRQIHAKIKTKYKYKKSLWSLFYYAEELLKGMVAWNTTHAEGMLNPAAQDKWATDALLADFGQPEGLEAPNGLKLDAGWWLDNVADWWRKHGSH